MGIKVTNLDGLLRFKNAVDNLCTENLSNKVADAIAEEGKAIASVNYSGVSGVDIQAEKAVDGQSRVTASKEGIAYIEFGTGTEGETSGYKGNLKIPHSFQSVYPIGSGSKIHLSEWTYAYAHKLGYTDTKIKGAKAQAQMYSTYLELNKKAKDIAKNVLKGGKK